MKRYISLAPLTILTLSSVLSAHAQPSLETLKTKASKKMNTSDLNLDTKITETTSETISPLSEEFLMFLSEMEETNGEFVHPIDLIEGDGYQVSQVKQTNSDESDEN